MAIDWEKMVIGPAMKVFGEPVAYVPAIGQPFTIYGVFDEAYHSVDGLGDTVHTSTTMPVLGVRAADFPQPPQQIDQLTIQRTGITYAVADVHPDGHGHIKLLLNYVSGG
ncbi:hypothetical protein NK214_12090 [Chromobacterium sp. S0633]|uniref:head-tail joining protein n=1 Tax=Chromobacterium sp. S0633 TaxID=2957805 RepID=UPI00209E6FA8|nr:hypothetical protein [Chromobacterium sp. S0633]MCP1290930.1 hypothetical protein [Chromobacterium sp. S0633]